MRNIMKQKFQSKRFPIGVFVFAIAVLLSGFGVGKVFAEEGTVDRSFDFDRNQMEGKAFVFYGDSITAGLGVPDEDKRYIDLLQDAYGFYAYNGAVSGASLTKGDKTINDIYSQLEASEYLYRDADYISIFMGTNDFGMSRPLGSASDQPGTGTVYASLRKVLDIITTANPDVKIMLLTPLYRCDGSNSGFTSTNNANYTLADVTKAIRTVGEEYNCKVVDMTNVVNAENYKTLLNKDKLHVKAAGYAAMKEAIVSAE